MTLQSPKDELLAAVAHARASILTKALRQFWKRCAYASGKAPMRDAALPTALPPGKVRPVKPDFDACSVARAAKA